MLLSTETRGLLDNVPGKDDSIMSADDTVDKNDVGTGDLQRLRGRPKDSEKHTMIIGAAKTLFFEKGFENVRVDDVAKLAGVSKMTVYSHFEDKASLFVACVRSSCDDMLLRINAPGGRPNGANLRETLNEIGINILTRSLDRRTAIQFLLHNTALLKHPDLALRQYQAGDLRVRTALAAVLDSADARGELKIDSSLNAAEDLLSLWQGGLLRRIALGLVPPLSPSEIARRVERGTDLFLRACGAQADGPGPPR